MEPVRGYKDAGNGVGTSDGVVEFQVFSQLCDLATTVECKWRSAHDDSDSSDGECDWLQEDI